MGTIRNLLRTASYRLEAFFEQNVAEFIEYRPRGEQRTSRIRATIGGQRADAEESQSVRTEIENQDFLIRAATPVECQQMSWLIWLGREPIQNDEITFDGQRYLVTPALGGESFRYTDGFRTTLRVHTTHAGAQ